MAFLSFLRISSLTGRTLVQIALGVTLIVALSSAVSYYLMYRQVKQRASEQLNHYVVQRAHSEEQIFLLARDTQNIIQRAVLEQYDSYSDGRSLVRFDELYARQPDGSVRSRPETIGGRDPVTGWIHRDTPLTDELRRRMVLFHDVLEQFKPTSLMRFADIYFTSPEQINVGTDPPGVERWALSIEADFNQNAEQWVYFVDVAHNPKRATRWSDMYLDPVWKKLLVTVATPIDRADRHIGTIHNDLFLETLISNLLRSGIPGTKHCVFQADGHVIAHTDKIAQVRAAEGEYFIQASADPQLMSLLTAVQSAARWPVSGFDRDADQYYAISRLAGPEWYFASTISGKFMRAQAFRAAQWVLWTGLSSLVLLLIALAAILRRQIARPLGDLTMAAERVAAGESLVALTAHRRDELGRLTDVFNDMTRKIDERDAALRADKRDLEAALRDVQKADEEIRAQRATLQQREHLAAMGTLLAGVAHELNNPLSVVVGRAVMLEESAQPQIQGTVRRIRLAAERCARIVKTYLAMARHHEPQRSRVQLNDIIEAALDVLEHTLHMSDVQIVRRMAADLPELNADPDQLHQVFMNLFFNAQQAMSEHPAPRTLTITTGRLETEPAIQVLVADSGPGIPLEIRSRIFDPYFTTKPMGSGTGVGLAVSRGIIEAHGGSITVDGPPQGGTTFRIKLPLTEPVRIAASDAVPARAAERLRILIAEDEHDVRETLGDILASENHDIELCASGAEALQELAAGDYDLIISDLRMPGMDGLTLFREIEARWPKLAQRVVFVTGDSLTPAIRRFLGDAGRPVIEKPFTPADVRGAVAEVTAGKRVHTTSDSARAQDD